MNSNLVTPATVEPRNAFQAYYLLPEKTFLQELRIEFDIPPIDPPTRIIQNGLVGLVSQLVAWKSFHHSQCLQTPKGHCIEI